MMLNASEEQKANFHLDEQTHFNLFYPYMVILYISFVT